MPALNKHGKTQTFTAVHDDNEQMKEILQTVYAALSEKGYNPVNQIVGYIISGDPTYITSYKDARKKMAKLEQDEKSVHRRLDNLEKLTESVHVIATELKAMREDVNSLTVRVYDIEHRPQKRIETIISSLITALIGAFFGYLLK